MAKKKKYQQEPIPFGETEPRPMKPRISAPNPRPRKPPNQREPTPIGETEPRPFAPPISVPNVEDETFEDTQLGPLTVEPPGEEHEAKRKRIEEGNIRRGEARDRWGAKTKAEIDARQDARDREAGFDPETGISIGPEQARRNEAADRLSTAVGDERTRRHNAIFDPPHLFGDARAEFDAAARGEIPRLRNQESRSP